MPGLNDVINEGAILRVIYVPVMRDTMSCSAASRVVDINVIIIVIKENVTDRTVLLKILSYLPKHQ